MSESPRIILHNADTDLLAKWLLERFPNADFRACNSYEALPSLVESYVPDVVYSVRFAGSPNFPRDALLGPSGPRWIANGGAGTDHFGRWDPSKQIITNAAGVAAHMMAEYVLGSFLYFALDVPGLTQDKAARIWNPERKVAPLAGRKLLVVGLGHTGRAVAARAKAFGMHVLGTRANPCPMENVDEVHAATDLPDLLPLADFLAICVPLIPATQGLIGSDEIAKMKTGVVLADVSRGGVMDQAALHAALRKGKVAAAALDVFEAEPLPSDSALWALENVLISPHCSSVYSGWEKASFDLFLENLGLFQRGKPLRNIVDPSRGY